MIFWNTRVEIESTVALTQAHADAAFADIEQAVHSLDFSKIKPIPYMGFEFNIGGNFVLYLYLNSKL